MGELLLWLLLAGLYLVAVGAFFAFVGVPTLAVVSGAFAIIFVGSYAKVLGDVLLVRASPNQAALSHPPQSTPPEGEEPAYRWYFFGQALADLRHVLRVAYARCADISLRAGRWIHDELTPPERRLYTWPLALVCSAGLVVGVVAGGLLVGLVALTHVVVVVLLQIAGRLTAALIRGLDTAVLRIQRIGITCPHCYEHVPYPSYDCPGKGCRLRHRDVRPGRYGLFRRTCVCGATMPTLLLVGSHRLDAFCPYCARPLPEHTGTAAEVILPLFGGADAGKTRLMLAMITGLVRATVQHGATLGWGDAETERRYEQLRPEIALREGTWKTVKDLPRAYSLYVTPTRGPRRLVHVFDAAGELFDTTEDLQQLRYLRRASTFLFVVDPLAVRSFASTVSVPPDATPQAGGGTSPPEFVFQQTCQNIEAMGVTTKQTRLAVAISKADVLADRLGRAPQDMDSDAAEAWLRDELGLGNLVRSIRLNFGDARFFVTAAVTDEGGDVDASVLTLMRWVFQGEGLVLGEQAAAA